MLPRIAIAFVLFLTIGVTGGACGDGKESDEGATGEPTSRSVAETPGSDQTPEATSGTPAGSADGGAIEALVYFQAHANNTKDVPGFVGAFSDAYYADLGVSRSDAISLVSIFIGVPQVEVMSISEIEVAGDNATAQVDSNEGVIVSRERYTFVREAGEWRIVAIEELPVEPTAGRAVALRLVEYAFEFEEEQLQGGGYVLNVSNEGTQPHEIELMKLPSGVVADDLKNRDAVPAGVEVIGLFGPLDPAEVRTLVFADDLPAGSYALVCYLSTPTGQSNASLGMVRDLVID